MPQFISHQQLTDEALWQLMTQDDEQALAEIVRRYYRKLYHYAGKFSADRGQIEDCLQDLFLNLWEKRHELHPQQVGNYLYKMIRNALFEQFRLHKRFEYLPDSADFDEEKIEKLHLYIESDTGENLQEQLEKVLGQLPQRQREALYLRYYEGLSYEEIAEVMNVSHQTIANTLHRTLQKIKANWKLQSFLILACFSLFSF